MKASEATKQCCEDYLRFLQTILRPAAVEFEARLINNDLKLHHVFQANFLAAHMFDYLVEIRQKVDPVVKRTQLIKTFDQNYAVEGAIYLNRKFQLVDAVNNALKHVKLDDRPTNREPIAQYGPIRFDCLREQDGVVLFEAERYRFDFARVALRPVLAVVASRTFEEAEDVLSFALGESGGVEVVDLDDDDPDPIDQMIDYCNPNCLDCGEGGDDCRCSEYRYGDNSGEFRGDQDEFFDFDAVMSRISGAYRPD